MDSRAETLADEKLGEEKETERTRSPSPSPIPSIVKGQKEFGDQPTDIEDSSHEATREGGGAPAAADAVYPSGFILAAIVIALLLSIFLVRAIALWLLGDLGTPSLIPNPHHMDFPQTCNAA